MPSEMPSEMPESSMTVQTWVLPDMHCVQCVRSLEILPEHVEGVWQAEVHFPSKSVRVAFDPARISEDDLESRFRAMGFPPLPIHDAPTSRTLRPLIARLAVAGFAFGNVMMMSLADYVGGPTFQASGFERGFKVWSMVLTLPVLLFSAAPFFQRAWAGIRQRSLNLDMPVALGILTLTAQSLWMDGLGYFDSLAGLVFFLLLGQWYQSMSQSRLMREHSLDEWLPLKVTRVADDGTAALVPLADVDAGMTLRLFHGEIVPADGRLASRDDASLDLAFLNGESLPKTVRHGEPIHAGSRNVGPALDLVVAKAVHQSDLMRMWNSEAFQKDLRSSLLTPIDQVAQHFTWVVLALASLGWLAWWPDATMAWTVFASVLIVACPCALALSIPFAYGATARHLAARGFFLKHTDVVERFAQIRDVVFDKTGTLTTSSGFAVQWHPAENAEAEALEAAVGLARQSAHPLSRALVTWAGTGVASVPITSYNERPGQGLEGHFQGSTWRLGSAAFTGGVDPRSAEGTWVHLTRDGQHEGVFFLTRPLRPDAARLLQSLRDQGHPLHLLSGDGDGEASRFAPWFDALNMHFHQSPQAKMAYVARLDHAAMVGDGLNDAGALRTATLGLAVADELYAFTPSADALVEASSLAKLPEAIALAAAARRTVKLLLAVSVAYNVVGLGFALQGWLTPLVAAVLMPLSSLTVVVLALARAKRAARKLTLVSFPSHVG